MINKMRQIDPVDPVYPVKKNEKVYILISDQVSSLLQLLLLIISEYNSNTHLSRISLAGFDTVWKWWLSVFNRGSITNSVPLPVEA